MNAPTVSLNVNNTNDDLTSELISPNKSRISAEKLIEQTFTEGCPIRTAEDFKITRNIGEGSYSCVYSCIESKSGARFAIKVLQKSYIARHDKMEAIVRENKILGYLTQICRSHFFISQLYTSFHDKTQIYFVMNFVERGNLAESLAQYGSFDSETTRFFGSEILTGMQFLHDHSIIHRDLKPENVLIRENGHIVIADFGSAATINELVLPTNDFTEENLISARSSDSGSPQPAQRAFSDDDSTGESSARRTTFVGTALYVSPEMLADGEISAQTDIWGLGCILFQCLAGQAPFRAVNQYHLLKKIRELDFVFPEGFPDVATSLIKDILVKDPNMRLNADKLRIHPFFENIDWENVKTSIPPKLHAYLPATFGEPEFYSNINLPAPEIDDEMLESLFSSGRELTSNSQPSIPWNNGAQPDYVSPGITPRSDSQLEKSRNAQNKMLEDQRSTNPFHIYTNNSLILKQGYLEKKRGLFARRRMFLLTEGPHLLYIDVPNQVLKGEIPWTPCMQIELKNSGTFFIHTPNRVYYLFDTEKKADEWCKAIEEVRKRYERQIEQTYLKATRDGTFTSIYGKKKSRKEMLREQKALRRKMEKAEKKKEKEALKEAKALERDQAKKLPVEKK